MGRAALDEDAIRLIEASNPDLQFDWTRILKGQAEPDTVPAERRGQRAERERGRPAPDRRTPRPTDERPARPAVQPEPEPPTAEAPAETVSVPEEPMTAAHARLGSEGLGRLRARYAETMARITERVPDAERQAQLKTLAERLNPDGWVTDGDVSAGLESYERIFEELRGSIGNRRGKPRPGTETTSQPA